MTARTAGLYTTLAEEDVVQRLAEARAELGSEAVILGHHYQRYEVIQFADYRGDSLELSRIAATKAKEAKYIVFCGVDFMAETAAMLCGRHQTVVLPAGEAPCPMAGMAEPEDAQVAWEAVMAAWNGQAVPITYQNSTAEMKAFCGQRGGAVCTSANAQALFRWAFGQGKRVLFFPDEHLGRNTAVALGIPVSQIVLWDPRRPSPAGLRDAQVVVWKGHCCVHTRFRVKDVEQVREEFPRVSVVVHPECTMEVVQASDLNGSTSFIVRTTEQAPPGAQLAIGTEVNLVSRLAREHPDKTVVPLRRSLCTPMFRTSPRHLLAELESLLGGQPANVIRVPEAISRWANLALERMLNVS